MAPATFYTVNGPRGVYYAVHNHHSGKFWTERTEIAAEQQATEEGLAIVASETINHSQLLDLMISEASRGLAAQVPAAKKPVTPDSPTIVRFKVEGGLTRFLKRFSRHEKIGSPEESTSR